MVAELPAPAQRYFLRAIASGVPLRMVAELEMTGEIGLGTKVNPAYRPMYAREIIAPPHGFVWLPTIGTGLARITGSDGLWCVNQAVDVRRSLGTFSGDALRHRHPEPGHPVEHRAADPGFGLLGPQSPGAKTTTDEGFVAEHGSLSERAPAVANRRLPAQAALVPDHLDVLVALTGRGARGRARHGGGARRGDHRHGGIGLTLSHGAVNGLAVIGPVRDHRGKGTGDLVEQGADLGGIPLLVARQLGREDLTSAGINGQMKLTPGPLAPFAMRLDQPLARAV